MPMLGTWRNNSVDALIRSAYAGASTGSCALSTAENSAKRITGGRWATWHTMILRYVKCGTERKQGDWQAAQTTPALGPALVHA